MCERHRRIEPCSPSAVPSPPWRWATGWHCLCVWNGDPSPAREEPNIRTHLKDSNPASFPLTTTPINLSPIKQTASDPKLGNTHRLCHTGPKTTQSVKTPWRFIEQQISHSWSQAKMMQVYKFFFLQLLKRQNDASPFGFITCWHGVWTLESVWLTLPAFTKAIKITAWFTSTVKKTAKIALQRGMLFHFTVT